jgi:hypothetical protein
MLSEREAELAIVSELYQKERDLAIQCKSELEKIKGSVRVNVRCRPFLRQELASYLKPALHFRKDKQVLVNTPNGYVDFEFDHTFGPTSTQEEVFRSIECLDDMCLLGQKMCLFSYGQYNSGKSYTLFGQPTELGLIPRAINSLFKRCSESAQYSAVISSSCYEIKGDNLIDRYAAISGETVDKPQSLLRILIDDNNEVVVEGAVTKEASDPVILLSHFEEVRKSSSNCICSHFVYIIKVSCTDVITNSTAVGSMTFVDVAGAINMTNVGGNVTFRFVVYVSCISIVCAGAH